MGRQTSQFFSLNEDFEISSPLKWPYIGCFSMSFTGVVFMVPSMTRRAMFWTLSSLLILVLAAVPHVVDVYSKVGRTVAVQTLVRTDESAPLRAASFVIKASFYRLLLSIFSICGFQVSRVSSFTPRKVGMSVWGTISSFSRSFICFFEVKREKRVLLVLPVFISKPQSCVHLLIPLMASWIL